MGGGGRGPDLAALARAERDRAARRAQAERDRAARKAQAERDRAARRAKAEQEAAAREAEKNTVDVRGGMAQGEENLRQFRDNAVDVGRDVQSMGSDVLEFLTGARKPEDIVPGIQNNNKPPEEAISAFADYSDRAGGGGRAGSGRMKKAGLQTKTSKMSSSKSKLYVRSKSK